MIILFECINYKFLFKIFPVSENYGAIILGLYLILITTNVNKVFFYHIRFLLSFTRKKK